MACWAVLLDINLSTNQFGQMPQKQTVNNQPKKPEKGGPVPNPLSIKRKVNLTSSVFFALSFFNLVVEMLPSGSRRNLTLRDLLLWICFDLTPVLLYHLQLTQEHSLLRGIRSSFYFLLSLPF